MKKLYFTLLIIVFQLFNYVNAQIDTANAKYFDELIETLSNNENIIEIKRINKKILFGEYFLQSVYVKYSNDQSGKFWLIGKQFAYYTKNNQLAISRNIDTETGVLSDTTFYYSEDGALVMLDIFPEYFDNYIPVNTGPANWSGIKGYVERYPNQYKTIEFLKNTDEARNTSFIYTSNKGFKVDESNNNIIIPLDEDKSEFSTRLMEDLVDTRDGKSYKTVALDATIWMTQNLAFKPEIGKYWVFRKDDRTIGDLGYLYDWETANNVCPSGWRIPSKDDYTNLINHIALNSNNVYSELIPNGSSGLNISYAGVKYGTSFVFIEDGSVYWSSTESKKNTVWGFSVSGKTKSAVVYPTFNKKSGIPVRCIKDINEDQTGPNMQ